MQDRGNLRYSNSQIEFDAKKYGYKAANLINLQDIIGEFNQSPEAFELRQLYGDIKLGVPNFEPIDEKVIRQHLERHFPAWKDRFQQFQQAFNSQDNQGSLGEEAKKQLQSLQESIITCFKEHPVPEEIIDKFLSDNHIESDSLLMVRSTGIHEDRADMANPGGNESVPCRATIANISAALGVVAASYIGEKSLSQRLGAGDKSITDIPVMPGLIQQMIGEGMDSSNQSVSSGVVYTNGGTTRMQAAPGHGEYVVNSKGTVDNYYISSEGVVYSEIASKDFRLVPNINIDGDKAVSLERKDNESALKYSPALNSESSIYLHELSKFIEKKYGNRVDIEFVYKPAYADQAASINIVQVRAIPEGNRRGLEPSALSPNFLGENKEKLTAINGLQVITPEVNKAAVINDSKQVITASNIEQALSEYNKLGQDGRITIKAVIVQTPAPDTSHEAGVFNAGGIAVMQVKDIEEFRKLIPTSQQQAIIIDPQHSKIYQLSTELGTDERELYQQGVIAKGIYASALSNYVTPINYDFSKVRRETLSKQPIANEAILQDKTLGTLIAKARNGDKDSLDQLLSAAYKVVHYKQEKQQTENKDKGQLLHDNIDILASPKIRDNNESLREALGYNLRATVDAYKKGYISQAVFKQTIITGTELSVLLDHMKQQVPKELAKEQEDKIYLEYFNVQKKFSGLNINQLASSIKVHKYQELAEKLNPQVTGKTKEYLIESLKLGDYLISREQQNNWNKFCASICNNQDNENAKRLGSLVNTLVSYKAHEQWINYIFTETNNPQQLEATLAKLEEDFTKIDLKKLKDAVDITKGMESQIAQWSNPSKFENLYKELQTNLTTINNNLQWNRDATNLEKILIIQQVHHLVDIMDKSAKSLERSNLYTDEMQDDRGHNLQVVRFKEILKEYHNLMVIWFNHADFESAIKQRIELLGELLDRNFNKVVYTMNQPLIQYLIKEAYASKSEYMRTVLLSPSDNFSVTKAAVNSAQACTPRTLEDSFTLIHQNLLLILAKINQESSYKNFEQQYPDLVKKLDEEFNTKISNYFDKEESIIPTTICKFDKGKLIISKHFPLRGHSILSQIQYDVQSNSTSVIFDLFSGNENNRNANIALDNYLDLAKIGCSFITKPYFNQKSVFFEVKVENNQQINAIIRQFQKSINTSYELANETGKSLSTHLLDERVETLNILDSLDKKILQNIEPIPNLPIKWPIFKELSPIGKDCACSYASYLPDFFPAKVKNIEYTEQELKEVLNKGVDINNWCSELVIQKARTKYPNIDNNPEKVEFIYTKSMRLQFILNQSSIENTITYCHDNFETAKVIIENANKISDMLKNNELSVDDVLKCNNTELIQDLVKGRITNEVFKELVNITKQLGIVVNTSHVESNLSKSVSKDKSTTSHSKEVLERRNSEPPRCRK